MTEQRISISARGFRFGPAESPTNIGSSTNFGIAEENFIWNMLGVDPLQGERGAWAHFFTKPGDRLFLRRDKTYGERLSAELYANGMSVNSRLWEKQLGTTLACPSYANDALRMVPPGEDIFAAAAKDFKAGAGSVLSTSMWPRTAEFLGIDTPPLSQVSRTNLLLSDKNRCMELLGAHGIRVPPTFCVSAPSELKAVISALPKDKRFIIKRSGSTGGIGIVGVDHGGIPYESLLVRILETRAAWGPDTQYQLQEFIPGRVYGAVAIFGNTHDFDIRSIHQQELVGSRFKGAQWNANEHRAMLPEVGEIFNQLARIPNLTLRGTIGIDFIIDSEGRPTVIEVNPRFTGASIFGILRSLETSIRKHLENSRFEIRHLSTGTDLEIPSALFARPALLESVFFGAKADVSALHDGASRFVLPQGLDPFGNTACVFVNDADGALEECLKKRITASLPAIQLYQLGLKT